MNTLTRLIFLIYFITHIPITLTVDLQIVFGKYYPTVLQELFRWYITTFNDQLLQTKPLWLQSFIYAELLLQTPFFFISVYCLMYRYNWYRIPAIIYGSHVATTVWPILTEIILSNTLSNMNKAVLCSFYVPYFVIPLSLMIYMVYYPIPFPDKQDTKNNNNNKKKKHL